MGSNMPTLLELPQLTSALSSCHIHTSVQVQKQGDASNRLRERLDNYGASAENKAEAEKMGLLKYMKKNRQYAQFSYQDYRIPQSRPEISISCTNTIVDKEIGLPTQETTFKGRTVEKAKRTMQENQSNRAIKKVDKTFHKKRFGQEAPHLLGGPQLVKYRKLDD